MSSSSSSSNAPHDNNPILAAYEKYVLETPMVTRVIMCTHCVSFIVNIFFDLSLGLANIPMFTIYRFEIYRIITSLFVCTDGFLSLILTYFSFVPAGKRLENCFGSTEYACFFLTIGVITNVLYNGLAFLLDALAGQGGQYWLIIPSSGLWNVLFGMIAMECTKAPQGSVRKVFFFTVPTIYYPIALLGLFSFLGGFSLAHLISIGLGYGFGYGYLDFFRISASRCKAWEERYLQTFISQDRSWIISSTAMGSVAWSEEMMTQQQAGGSSASGTSGLGGFFSRWRSQMQQQQQQQQQPGASGVAMGSDDVSVPGDPRPGRVIKPSATANKNNANASTSVIPTSGGQQLGGRSRRQNTDPRQARLQALERRMANNSDHQP